LFAVGVLACSSPGEAPKGFSTVFMTSGADGGAPPALVSVRGSGAGTGWAVGEAGTIARLSGSSWTLVDSGTTATLGGLSVLDVGHAWAAELGGARVLAWNGRWAPLGDDRAGRAAAATWGVAANDVWVAGDGIEHWDGQAWTQEVPSGTAFTSMFGTFRTDVWAVGPGGIRHYDGKTWSTKLAPSGAMPLAAVWASQLYDAWFVGAGGTILHWNGSALSTVISGTTVDLTCIAGTDAGDVWIGGKDGTLLHYDGSWSPYTTDAHRTITDVWRAYGADVYFVDDTGSVTRFVP
jgi:hypothetical protein